jgi:PHP family Zn ribbon phosphoesterase
MTREEAIKLLKQYQGYEPISPDGETLKHAFDLTDETVDTLLSALRPASREQLEKVWRGEWKGVPKLGVYDMACSKCGYSPGIRFYSSEFCPNCGAPMTDEAVQMVMERLEELKDDSTTD